MKKVKIISLYLLAAILFQPNAAAQNVEQIFMKSGSVVEGYLAEQNPGKSITIQASKATIVVGSDSLHNRIVERIPEGSLSAEWCEWAEQNDKFINNNGARFLELTTLEFENCIYHKVFVLEKGSLIKFVDTAPNKYSFAWGDMYRTVKALRPDNLFTGLKEILVLNDGSRIEGQIIEQFPGQDLKIVTEKGDVLSYKFSQVKQIVTEKLNDKFDLWSQIERLDKIKVKGEPSPRVGFISTRTLGKDLVFVSEDGVRSVIELKDITSFGKVPNEKYIAAYDKILEKGEVLLNGEAAYFVTLENMDKYILLGDIVSAQKKRGDTVCIEANLLNPEAPVTLVKAHLENISTKKCSRKAIMWPVITYQDFVQAPLPYLREKTPLSNVMIRFTVEEVGDYVLLIQGIDGYIIINVTE